MKKIISVLIFSLSISAQAQEIPAEKFFADLEYRNVGPSRGGRVTAVAGIESRQNEYYMGSTGGGVWKSVDYGQSWKNVSDGYFNTGSIGAIRVFQENPDIIYVGTGSDGIRSNVIIGKGVYRSNDAGASWKHLGLENAGQIGAILINPANPDICYVAAIGNPFGPNSERGVFRTSDGGESWEKCLFISDRTGSADLEFSPDNPDIIYASVWTVERKPWTILSGSEEGGVYRSIDGGDSWKKLEKGLPVGIIGKSDLAVCKSEPSFLYVLMEAEKEQNGLYLSQDYGESFKLISDYESLLDRPFYYCNIDVDPNDPDIIYVNTTSLHKSTDRGQNWNRMRTPHGDNHDMWINPADSDVFIQSNDGGANVTTDGGKSWSSQDNQPTAELYQVNLDDQFPYWLYAGQQDNSTLAIPSTGNVNSRRSSGDIMSVGGCETGPAVPKPGNHNIVYSNCKGRFGVYNKITGTEKQYYVGAINMYGHNPGDLKYRFQRVAPIMVSPHNPDVVYHASQYLHKTIDDGISWETISPDLTAFEPDKQVISGSPITRDITGEEFYSTIYAISESPLVEGIIWTGANDGPVYITKDGGTGWSEVTPAGLPAGGRVQTIEPSPHNPAKAYIAVYRYLLNDWEPYLFRTIDYGQTWDRITDGKNGIPGDCPVRVIREHPEHEGLLFAGTESGVFISFNDGLTWEPFQKNLPVVPVTDIKIYRNDLVLSTMGRSFWIMDNISPLPDLSNGVDLKQAYLFQPASAYRSILTRAADIDYYLPAEDKDASIVIENLDGESIAEVEIMQDMGFHRVSWNLSSGVSSDDRSRRRSSGIKLPPGKYIIKLKTSKGVLSRDLQVNIDPNVARTGVTVRDLEEQYDLCIQVRDLQEKAKELQERIDQELNKTREKADKRKGNEKLQSKLDNLENLRSLLVTDDGPYPQPMLISQIGYLYSMISRVDQKPGRDAWIRLEELKDQVMDITSKLDDL